MKEVKRGDIWLVNLDPVIGHEQAGTRPALVISDDLLNQSLAEIVIVMPLTTKNKGIPTHIEIVSPFLNSTSYIKSEDIRSISIKRLTTQIGSVDDSILKKCEEVLKMLLGFHD